MGNEAGKAADVGKRREGETTNFPLPASHWRGVLNVTLPSANVFMRQHWAVRKRQKDSYYLELYAAFKDNLPTKATGKRDVKIEITSSRLRDHANLWLAADKLILDNLVKLGWLVDDSPDYVDAFVTGKTGVSQVVIDIWGERK